MNRIAFCLLLLFAFGCGQVVPDSPVVDQEPEVDYGFTDEYYYSGGQKVSISQCEDEYVIAFSSDKVNTVLDYVDENGFTTVRNLCGCDFSYADLDIPDYLKTYMLLWIKGSADVDKIPDIFYSDKSHMKSDEYGEWQLFTSNIFYVAYDKNADEEQLAFALKRAEEFKIVLLSQRNIEKIWFTFACTDESVGNAIEIANWFYEKGGCIDAYPEFKISIWD